MSSANLILKHSDIGTGTGQTASSNAGEWSNFKQRAVFRVNLRELLGSEIYDNNNRFALRLNSASHTGQTAYNTASADVAHVIRLSGLNWSNCAYDFARGRNGSNYDCFMWYMEPAVARTFYLSDGISVGHFFKSSPQVEIVVELIRQSDGLPPSTANTFPACCFSFSVFPV